MKSIPSVLLAFLVMTPQALAISPTIRGMKPTGGRRGGEVVVAITGQRLADARDLLFYRPGITVRKVEGAKDDQVRVTLSIADDATPGPHDFRLRTATGISALRTFSVGALPEVEEKEPNNDFFRPQPIGLNVTVNGVAANEDVDHYSVKARKGERITVEIEGMRLGLTTFDPYVAIYNARRFELASSDDSALIWQDGLVSIIAPEDGTYTIVARESAYAGNANCLYRLHVGTFPRPTATVPAGGRLGSSIAVRWIGDVLGETTTSLELPHDLDRNFGLLAHDRLGTAPQSNVFRLSPFGNVIESEPDDKPGAATRFVPPMALNGVIGTAGDVDHFAFRARKGQKYDIRVFARRLRSPLDSVLTISPRNGPRIASNDDSGGPDSTIRFVAPRDGEYVLAVTDHLKKGGPDYAYRVEVTTPAPRLGLSTPNEAPRRGTGTMAIAVPRGNRQAILINADRVEFGGAVSLAATGLPRGVRFESDTMAAATSAVPVLFTADKDSPATATLAAVTGKPVDTRLDIPCEFTSTAELVLGQNNIPVWTRTVETLAVAVTEEAPFTIDVVEPRGPIVRGGTMELKVVARRKPGFTAPIAIAMPWNPPGLASKREVVIPEKQDEATILINASNGAPLTTWKIVVNGTFTEIPPGPVPKGAAARRGGRGRLTVSSGFARLTVAPQFLTLAFTPVSVEQGKTIDLGVKIKKAVDFPGEATLTLLGLPNKVTTPRATITRDTQEVVFHIQTDPSSPAGEVRNLFCEAVILKDGEPIVHHLGTGRLRIDKPLALKKPARSPAATRPLVAAGPSGSPVPDSPSRPLSRLEKLRLESKERARPLPDSAGSKGAPAGTSGSN